MSEDPFYCGETFEKVEEVIPREKIWRVKTEEEFKECYRFDSMADVPKGWNLEGHMSFLYGKPLDEIYKKTDGLTVEQVKRRLTAEESVEGIRSIVGDRYYEVYPGGSRQHWTLKPKDFTFDYPV